jgi:hypothetical protein
MNSFDILYSGTCNDLVVKYRTIKYLRKKSFVLRNNVFTSNNLSFAVHLRRNFIHLTICELNPVSQTLIEEYLASVFSGINFSLHNFNSLLIDFKNLKYMEL